jgi:hypothetical protein
MDGAHLECCRCGVVELCTAEIGQLMLPGGSSSRTSAVLGISLFGRKTSEYKRNR